MSMCLTGRSKATEAPCPLSPDRKRQQGAAKPSLLRSLVFLIAITVVGGCSADSIWPTKPPRPTEPPPPPPAALVKLQTSAAQTRTVLATLPAVPATGSGAELTAELARFSDAVDAVSQLSTSGG